MNDIEIEGEFYWVYCRIESNKPMIAEQTEFGWFLTGSEHTYTIEEIEIIEGPLKPKSIPK